ncbi:hypothetical protein [Actinomadura alba]|uniref:Uncharacterized protein n=1 Tax=Actinomadura alba TaxID=406431 RepID=A0ABR7LJV7_9ACTN|nr:hypothetical protein [Actinomadura alba]MBC6465083.1 hypothetical protein [Actinomadura alba]
MRGIYSHVTEAMRQQILDGLRARWETALKERAALWPESPVPVLDGLLKELDSKAESPTPETISTIPPIRGKSPTLVVGE